MTIYVLYSIWELEDGLDSKIEGVFKNREDIDLDNFIKEDIKENVDFEYEISKTKDEVLVYDIYSYKYIKYIIEKAEL